MTFESEERRFLRFAVLMGLVALAGVAGGVLLGPWWQRLAVFLGLVGVAYFRFMAGVFAFARRTLPLVEAADGDNARLTRWGDRWMRIVFGCVVAVALVGVVEIVRADGWGERIAIFYAAGGAALFAAMGAIFGFCALPQMRSGPPGGRD